jgi:hypothetical protein
MTDDSKIIGGKLDLGQSQLGQSQLDKSQLDTAAPSCSEMAACRRAVMRTYERLRSGGSGDRVAFEAAGAVYAWHHPEVPRERVPFVIADWLP